METNILTFPDRSLARIGKKVLHLDSHQNYGGNWSVFGFRELAQWYIERNKGRSIYIGIMMNSLLIFCLEIAAEDSLTGKHNRDTTFNKIM